MAIICIASYILIVNSLSYNYANLYQGTVILNVLAVRDKVAMYESIRDYREPDWNISLGHVIIFAEALQPTVLSTAVIHLSTFLCQL